MPERELRIGVNVVGGAAARGELDAVAAGEAKVAAAASDSATKQEAALDRSSAAYERLRAAITAYNQDLKLGRLDDEQKATALSDMSAKTTILREAILSVRATGGTVPEREIATLEESTRLLKIKGVEITSTTEAIQRYKAAYAQLTETVASGTKLEGTALKEYQALLAETVAAQKALINVGGARFVPLSERKYLAELNGEVTSLSAALARFKAAFAEVNTVIYAQDAALKTDAASVQTYAAMIAEAEASMAMLQKAGGARFIGLRDDDVKRLAVLKAQLAPLIAELSALDAAEVKAGASIAAQVPLFDRLAAAQVKAAGSVQMMTSAESVSSEQALGATAALGQLEAVLGEVAAMVGPMTQEQATAFKQAAASLMLYRAELVKLIGASAESMLAAAGVKGGIAGLIGTLDAGATAAASFDASLAMMDAASTETATAMTAMQTASTNLDAAWIKSGSLVGANAEAMNAAAAAIVEYEAAVATAEGQLASMSGATEAQRAQVQAHAAAVAAARANLILWGEAIAVDALALAELNAVMSASNAAIAQGVTSFTGLRTVAAGVSVSMQELKAASAAYAETGGQDAVAMDRFSTAIKAASTQIAEFDAALTRLKASGAGMTTEQSAQLERMATFVAKARAELILLTEATGADSLALADNAAAQGTASAAAAERGDVAAMTAAKVAAAEAMELKTMGQLQIAYQGAVASMNALALAQERAVSKSKMTAAFNVALADVKAYSDAILRAKNLGLDVASSEAAIAKFDKTLETTAGSLGLVAVQQLKVTTNSRNLAAAAAMARDNVAGWGRAFALFGSTTGVAALLTFVALNAAIKQLNERGAAIPGIGDLIAKAFDALATSLGLTTAQMGKMVEGLEGTLKGLEGLDPAAHMFASGLALVSAAGGDAQKNLDLFAAATPKVYDEMAVLSTSTESASADIEGLNYSLNIVRTTMPDVAEKLTKMLIEIGKMPAGSAEAAEATTKWERELEAAKETSEKFAASLKSQLGHVTDVGNKYRDFANTTLYVGQQLEKAKAAGLDEDEALAKLGSTVQKVVEGYDIFSGVKDEAAQATLRHAAAIVEEGKGMDANSVKWREAAAVQAETKKNYEDLQGALDRSKSSTEDYNIALLANRAAVESQAAALEKERIQHGHLTEEKQRHLDILKNEIAQIKVLTGETDKMGDAALKAKDKVAQLGFEQLKAAQAFAQSLAAIREHAQQVEAGADKELKAIRASVDAQIAELGRLRSEGSIENAEYRKRIDELQGYEVDARRATEEKLRLIQEERVADEKKVTDAYVEQLTQRILKLHELGATIEGAAAKAALEIAAQREVTEAARAEAAAIAAGMTTHRGYESMIKDRTTALNAAAKAERDITRAQGEGVANRRDVERQARDVAKAYGEQKAAAEGLANVSPAVAGGIGGIGAAAGSAAPKIAEAGAQMDGVAKAADAINKATENAGKGIQKSTGEWVPVVKEAAHESVIVFGNVAKEVENVGDAVEESGRTITDIENRLTSELEAQSAAQAAAATAGASTSIKSIGEVEKEFEAQAEAANASSIKSITAAEDKIAESGIASIKSISDVEAALEEEAGKVDPFSKLKESAITAAVAIDETFFVPVDRKLASLGSSVSLKPIAESAVLAADAINTTFDGLITSLNKKLDELAKKAGETFSVGP